MSNALFVKDVLDQIYPTLQPKEKLDEFIYGQILSISGNYAVAASSPSLSFSDPRTRMAYIYMYVGAHARYLAKILHIASRELGGVLFNSGNIKVSCLGGGPGTDALGILKYLRENKKEPIIGNLTCNVFDKEPSWNQNWHQISRLAGAPLNPFFATVDVSQELTPAIRNEISDSDLITISYLISEVEKLNGSGNVSRFFEACFDLAKPGALLVYVDNSGSHTDFFDAIPRSEEWILLSKYDWSHAMPQWGSDGEDVTPLDGYKKKFFDRSYRIAAKLSFRIFKKT